MSLESKAYPREALCFASCETCMLSQNDCQRKKLWVPLEEAKKEIEQIQTDEDKHAQTLIEQRDKAEQTIEAINKYRANETERALSFKKELKKIECLNLEKQNRILNALKILEEIPEPVGAKLPSINDLQIVYHQEALRQWRIRLHDTLSTNHKEESKSEGKTE